VLAAQLGERHREQHEQRGGRRQQRRVQDPCEERRRREQRDHEQAEHEGFPFPGPGKANGVAAMFWAYLALVVAGLAVYLAIGLAG
jgi:hypothetical protein